MSLFRGPVGAYDFWVCPFTEKWLHCLDLGVYFLYLLQNKILKKMFLVTLVNIFFNMGLGVFALLMFLSLCMHFWCIFMIILLEVFNCIEPQLYAYLISWQFLFIYLSGILNFQSIIRSNLQYAALSALRRLPLDPGNPAFLHRAVQGWFSVCSSLGFCWIL